MKRSLLGLRRRFLKKISHTCFILGQQKCIYKRIPNLLSKKKKKILNFVRILIRWLNECGGSIVILGPNLKYAIDISKLAFGLPIVVDLGWTNSIKTDLIELDLCKVWAFSNCTKGDGHGLGSKFLFKTIEGTHLTKFLVSCKFLILKYLFISEKYIIIFYPKKRLCYFKF